MRIKVIIPFAVDQVGVAKRSAQIPRSIIDEGGRLTTYLYLIAQKQ